MPQVPEANRFAQILENMRKDIEKLKASSSATQLSNSSIDVFEGRGYIPIIENGVEKHRIGRQPDGTITSVSKNNSDPPATPLAPVCTPFIGGVAVQCIGFGSQQFLDFSHVRVYVDDQLTDVIMKIPGSVAITPLEPGPHRFYLRAVNLSETASPRSPEIIASPNLVVGNDIAEGIITDLQLANEAVTNAKLATDSVTGTKIAAETIEGSMIAAQTILGEKIAAAAITGDKIAANSITALKIAANAIESAAIKAGSITGEKLSAQVILATASIIVGNPVLARLVLDATGLTQIDEKGNISMQIGATPSQGNYITIIDPTDSTNALATIGRDGSITINGINITGFAFLNGVDLISFLNGRPQGIVAQGKYTGNAQGYSPGTSSQLGLIEVACNVTAGRSYRITTDQCAIYGEWGYFVIQYTLDGSIPNVNSPVLYYTPTVSYEYGQTQAFTDGHRHGAMMYKWMTMINNVWNCTQSGTLRLLFSLYAIPVDSAGSASWRDQLLGPVYLDISPRNTMSGAISRSPTMYMTVEDLGTTPYLTGGDNAGSGSSSATATQIRTFSPTYTKYFSDQPGASAQEGLQQGKVGNINYVSMLGWDQSPISLALNSATVKKVELYLYSNYWALSEGGFCSIGTHNASGIPSSYSYTSRDVVDQFMKKPQGLWITLPNSIATQLASGSIKGLVFDCRTSHPSTSNYGIFREQTYIDATIRPSLRITYVK